jgi:hypothetical protein
METSYIEDCKPPAKRIKTNTPSKATGKSKLVNPYTPSKPSKVPQTRSADVRAAAQRNTAIETPVGNKATLNGVASRLGSFPSEEKAFIAALAEEDPKGEARLDFKSSKEYYSSPVFKARCGKPSDKWGPDAYIPASAIKTLSMENKGKSSSYAPTFNPAPEET